MPDGDRFERALRGPWRFPFRIAAGGASAERVAGKLSSSCLGVLNGDIVHCARKMMTALDAAFAHNSMPLFFGESQNTAFQQLVRGLDVIAAEYHYDELAQSCGRAISRCFLGMEQEAYVSDERLELAFAREFVGEIVGRHFFPIVRERLSENTGRDSVAQQVWETRVLECMSENLRSVSQALFAEDSDRRGRRHTRSTPVPSFDWSRLNEPLHVLGA